LIQYLKGFFWLIRPMRKYWKTLDIVQFEKDILKIQSRPNLHPDTILYYNILFMQCVLVHSKEKFFEYYKKCSSPQTKGLQPLYRGLILRYGMTKEEFDHSFEILNKEFYNKKSVLKRVNKFYQFWQPYYGMNSNYINEKLYRIDRKKNQYQNAISLFVLIYYYKNNGQLDKAAELKTEFVKKYSVFEECIRDLETI
ncbi:MAG: hypothetical protein K2N65_02545, partial [Anaeroplasmataceae bacterium]|nr:hypothetical protein [Anaeroplasmataceae bacterium]